MNYWLFKGNPAKYDIDARLRNPEPRITWTVSRYEEEISSGDIAFICRSGPDREIVAVMQIDSEPKETADYDSEMPYVVDLPTGAHCRVSGILTHRHINLPAEKLREVPELRNFCLFHGFQQATNFRVTAEEGKTIMALIDMA